MPDGYLIQEARGGTVWGIHFDELAVPFAFRARLRPNRGERE